MLLLQELVEGREEEGRCKGGRVREEEGQKVWNWEMEGLGGEGDEIEGRHA